jgi:hypothetical protein
MVSWCDEIGSRAHYITNSLALSGGTVLFCPADEVRASRGLHHRALRLRSTYTRSAHYSPEDFRERELFVNHFHSITHFRAQSLLRAAIDHGNSQISCAANQSHQFPHRSFAKSIHHTFNLDPI